MKSAKLCGLLAALIVASAALAASAATWHIYQNGSGDAPTIKAAVGLAAAGDSIVVFPGTYNEHDINVTKQLFIVSTGGYSSTSIDAQSLGRCFEFNKLTPTIAIKGFTLRHGTGQYDPVYTGFGGAVLCRSRSHVDLIDCAFRNNSANLGGAALARDSSTVTFKRCSFFDNLAYQDNYPGTGGAIEMLGSIASYYALSATIDSCLFVNNTAQMDGGAIYATFCYPSISHSTFYQNHASSTGGAISYGNAALDLAHCIVSHSDCYGILSWYPNLGGVWADNDFYANASGNYGGIVPDQTGYNCNISADPLYCNAPGDMSISTISPCAPAINPCGQLIGRYGPTCQKGPNLAVASVIWSGTTPQPGTNVTGTIKIKNTGNMSAGPFYVDYYKDRLTSPPGGLHGDERHYVASLAAGDSVSWTTSPATSAVFTEWQSYFRVDTDAQVLELNETDNLSGPHTIAWQVPNESGWPTVTAGSFHSSPVIAAIDDNLATLEIAIGCDNGKLYAWRPDGTDVPGFPVTLPDSVVSSPAVGDITGDYRNEIVVGCNNGALYVYDRHGAQLWFYAMGSPVRTTPSLADINGDGKLEIVCTSGGRVHVLRGSGAVYKGWPYEVEGAAFASPAVGDVDGDGTPEIAVAARINASISRVYLFEGNGEMFSGAWPVQLDGIVTAGPALGNINTSSAGLEIVVGATDGRVYVITTAGNVWTTIPQVTGSISTSPIIEDVDHDGRLDIVVSSKIHRPGGEPPVLRWNGFLTAINRLGEILPGWPQAAGYWPSDVGPVPSATALGTDADVMAGSPYNQFFSWYGSGVRTPSFPIYFGANIITSAAAGDVDGDGWVEIFVATSAGTVHCRELRSYNYTKDNLWWPMYGHDRARTHCYGFDVPTAVDDDLAATPKVTALGAIYPNPFNPLTKIAFDLGSKEHVELAIYDVSGRKLAVLVDRVLEAGRHEALWNGKTAGGTTAASGIYFCTLRTASVSETKKLVLLR